MCNSTWPPQFFFLAKVCFLFYSILLNIQVFTIFLQVILCLVKRVQSGNMSWQIEQEIAIRRLCLSSKWLRRWPSLLYVAIQKPHLRIPLASEEKHSSKDFGFDCSWIFRLDINWFVTFSTSPFEGLKTCSKGGHSVHNPILLII